MSHLGIEPRPHVQEANTLPTNTKLAAKIRQMVQDSKYMNSDSGAQLVI